MSSKHFEKFDMCSVAKLHRLGPDKEDAQADYLSEIRKKAYRRPMTRLAGVKQKFMPVLLPLLMSGGAGYVATSIVFTSQSIAQSIKSKSSSKSSSRAA